MPEILLHVTGAVATITLNAPERRNALAAEMVRELVAACDAVDADASIGAVIVNANGESFCAGAQRTLLERNGSDPARADHYDELGLTYRAFVRVGELRPPTIAAVRGHAVGAGVNLMMATDLRIVAETAMIIAGFGKIGVHPGGGHFALLGRSGSRETAAALSVFGEEIDGLRAAQTGLAWEAVPEGDVERRAFELAARAARDPELARATVRSMRTVLGPPALPWGAALDVERAPQMWSLRRRSA